MEDNILKMPSELEKVVRKSVDLATCPHNDCICYAEYWKCYNSNEKYCEVYLDFLKNSDTVFGIPNTTPKHLNT